MTEAALIVNALAIICGFMNKPVFMYVLFGFVWTAFFSIYEKLTWIWYEKVLRNETNEVMVNVKIAHIVRLYKQRTDRNIIIFFCIIIELIFAIYFARQ